MLLNGMRKNISLKTYTEKLPRWDLQAFMFEMTLEELGSGD